MSSSEVADILFKVAPIVISVVTVGYMLRDRAQRSSRNKDEEISRLRRENEYLMRRLLQMENGHKE